MASVKVVGVNMNALVSILDDHSNILNHVGLQCICRSTVSLVVPALTNMHKQTGQEAPWSECIHVCEYIHAGAAVTSSASAGNAAA
jgi:hypothetical protein